MKSSASWWQRKIIAIPSAMLAGAMVIACGAGSDDTGNSSAPDPVAGGTAPAESKKKPDGIYKFGETVKFKDGSTLTVGKPVDFKRAQFAIGGEKSAEHVKFKATFKNNTDEVFDPALTTAACTAGGEEGETVYQEGMDSPNNKILPGKSVSWTMGYGVASKKDLQLEVNVGFLDYGTVIFTA